MEYRFSNPGDRLACFDLDHTLIKPLGGRKRYTKDLNDAELAFPNVREKLDELRAEGWRIVVFTNQKKKSRADLPLEVIYAKIDRLLGSDINVFVAYQNDHYRKPLMGMWDQLVKLNGEQKEAFYVGDAAGRKGDFSDSDYRFARNINVPFFTPEQYFLESKVKAPELKELSWSEPTLTTELKIEEPTVVMMIGRQASGKSSFVDDTVYDIPGITVISNDITGSASKSRTKLRGAIKSNEDFILLDNTHSSRKSRDYFLTEVPARYKKIAVWCEMPYENCRHMDAYRAYTRKCKRIPDVAFRVYNKKFEEPTLNEFDQIIRYVPEVPPEIKNYFF